jgi:hypothetical protein
MLHAFASNCHGPPRLTETWVDARSPSWGQMHARSSMRVSCPVRPAVMPCCPHPGAGASVEEGILYEDILLVQDRGSANRHCSKAQERHERRETPLHPADLGIDSGP